MNSNEIKGSDMDDDAMTAQTCPTCGMDKKDWATSHGYPLGGEAYCCEGCAVGTGCTCSGELSPVSPQPRKRGRKAA